MTLTEREQFIVVLMGQRSNKVAQKLPKEMRMNILRYIKAKKFPAITDEEWIEIAHDMDKVQGDMKTLFMEAWEKGDNIKDDKDMLELDQATLEILNSVDLDDLSKGVNLGSELSKENTALRKAKDMKREYDEKR